MGMRPDMKIDFVPIGLNISGTQVVITSGYSDYGIACDDITGVGTAG